MKAYFAADLIVFARFTLFMENFAALYNYYHNTPDKISIISRTSGSPRYNII